MRHAATPQRPNQAPPRRALPADVLEAIQAIWDVFYACLTAFQRRTGIELRHDQMIAALVYVARWRVANPGISTARVRLRCQRTINNSLKTTRRRERRHQTIEQRARDDIAPSRQPKPLEDRLDDKRMAEHCLDVIQRQHGDHGVMAVSMLAEGATFAEIGEAIGASEAQARYLVNKIRERMLRKFTNLSGDKP